MTFESFKDFIEFVAVDRPLAESYFGKCISMKWDAWRVVRLLNATLDQLALPKPFTVLDIGCGIGIYEREMLKRWPSINMVGCDLSAKNIERAQEYEPGAFYIKCDVEHMPQQDKTVDLALSIEVMEHFLHPELVVSELARVIRPGGILIIVVPLVPSIPFLKRFSKIATRFIGSKVIEEGEFKEHMRIYNRKMLLRQFATGWQVKSLVTFNLMTFIVAALEKLSPAFAHWITERQQQTLDKLDLICGRYIYTKGMLVLERKLK